MSSVRCMASGSPVFSTDLAMCDHLYRQVLEKIMPINESGSDSFWVNDTIEVFRVCPEYGVQNTRDAAIVIGRNFRDSDVLVCRFTPCTSASSGPRQCQSPTSDAISGDKRSIEVSATYISGTRVQCPTPDYSFPSNSSLLVLDGVCEYDDAGVLAYVQSCEADAVSDGYCEDDAGTGYRFVYDTLVSGWCLHVYLIRSWNSRTAHALQHSRCDCGAH